MTSTRASDLPVTRLVARTSAIDPESLPGDLLSLLPPEGATAWVRRGDGLVAWGEAAVLRSAGPDRFADAAEWWRATVGAAVVRDEVQRPGTGLVCLSSFGFADDPGDSVLVVPQVVVGRRDGRAWVTVVGHGELAPVPELARTSPPSAPGEVVFADGAMSGAAWEGVVADAVQRIGAGDLEKVVLARDLLATLGADLDVRWPLARLASSYPMCWTFLVEGLFGATPELLVRRERGLVTSRVLAGTIRRTGDDARDAALAGQLARSSKDLEEHEYAVRSVADALAPYCSSTNVPEVPFVLHLPNVMHLATDVTGVTHDHEAGAGPDPAALLVLAAALHPSAAVGGTPTTAAVRLIEEIEGMDRGRYAAPVGWIDAHGDGELGIALRSAQLDPDDARSVRLFAGCGIVASSDPAAELAEAQAKLLPVRDALEGG
ncbi:isochorismate synthase [Nocardioides marmoraquaticus]